MPRFFLAYRHVAPLPAQFGLNPIGLYLILLREILFHLYHRSWSNKIFLPRAFLLDAPGVSALILCLVIWTSPWKVSNCDSTRCQCRWRNLGNEHTRHESVWYLSRTYVALAELVAILFLEIFFCHLVGALPQASLHTGYVKIKLCDHNDYWHCRHGKPGIRLRIVDSCLCYDSAWKSFLRLFQTTGRQCKPQEYTTCWITWIEVIDLHYLWAERTKLREASR